MERIGKCFRLCAVAFVAAAAVISGAPISRAQDSGEDAGSEAAANVAGKATVLDGSFAPNLTSANGSAPQALAVAVQRDGKTLVGGTFTHVDGVARNGIARLNPNGTLDPTFNPGTGIAGGAVETFMPLPDGKILIGGRFTAYNGVARVNIARINSNGSLDTSFNSGAGPNSWVNCFAVQPDGKVLVGGSFNRFDGVLRNRVARINPDGSLDPSINIEMTARPGITDIVLLPDGRFYIGGGFDFLYGVAWRLGVARFNPDGSLDTSFNPHANNTNRGVVATVVVQPDGSVVIAGNLAWGGSTTTNKHIVRLRSDGSLDQSFDSGADANNTIWDVVLQRNGKIVICGNFTSVAGVTRNRIARLDADGSLDASFRADAQGSIVYEITAQSDGKLVAAGSFSGVGGATRTGAARLLASPRAKADFDGDGRTDLAFVKPSLGLWNVLASSTNTSSMRRSWSGGDTMAAGDYDGDGKTDYACFNPGNGTWQISRSVDGAPVSIEMGMSGDRAVPADFDGDGRTDVAVFRSGTWMIELSAGGTRTENWGLNGDLPVAADMDGDGKADLTVYRPTTGAWEILNSSDGSMRTESLRSGGVPVAADFDGDGTPDLSVFVADRGVWAIEQSSNGSARVHTISGSGLIPVAGDYDGDGTADVAVFSPVARLWYYQQSSNGEVRRYTFGSGVNDIPVAGPVM